MGPFLAVYLAANRQWNPSHIGMAMAAMSFATVIAQAPAGFVVDAVFRKRGLIVVASLLIGCSALIIPLFPSLSVVIISQVLIGVSAALFIPTLIALASAQAGILRFDEIIGKNQTYGHAGNVVSAIAIGVIGRYTDNEGVFYCVAFLAMACVICVHFIHQTDSIQTHDENPFDTDSQISLNALFKNRTFAIFLISAFIFHFSNGAMLPLVGQEISQGRHENASLYMSTCIILAQLVMIPVTYFCGKYVKFGRKRLLLIGFAVLPVRGLLYTLSYNTTYLVSVQTLDGIAAGIFGVVSVIVIDDLMRNSGRANFAQGILAMVVGLGATLSNLISGFIVNEFGFNAGFVMLSVLGVLALILLWIAIPEIQITKAQDALQLE